MDEVVLRRVVGVITLAIAAFLLSWLLPRPGLDRLRGEGERVVTVDLTRPDAVPQEIPPPTEDEPPPPPVREPTEAELAAATAPPPEPVASEPQPEPAPPPKPVDPPKPAEPPRPVEPKPAASAPAETKPAAPKPAEPRPTPAPAPSASGGGQVMIQAGAYSHLDKAEQVRTKAGAQGQRCAISPAETAKGTLYRVRCGPFADRTQAQAAIQTLGAAGITAQIVGGAR